MSTPLVSILIPAYNAAPWLAETIESALAQRWPNKEIIVVDDGSTDDTLTVARRFEPLGVKVLQQENGGASSCRNRAYQEARGDFIQFLDADDLLSPDKIERQLQVLQRNPLGMVAYSPTVFFYDGEDPSQGLVAAGWPIVDSDDPLAWQIELLGPEGNAGMVAIHAWLTPRSITDAIGPWDEQRAPDDDAEYFARVALASKGLRRTEGLCYYRKHRTKKNLSQQGSKLYQQGYLRTLDLRANHILARTTDFRARKALASAYMARAFQAYPSHPDITNTALDRVRELGFDDSLLAFPSPKSRLVAKLFGWRVNRRMSLLFHQYVKTQN